MRSRAPMALLTAILLTACTATVGSGPGFGPGAGDGDGDADGYGDRNGDDPRDDGRNGLPTDDCGPCPAPGECRNGECLQPSEDGAWCEFDDECADTELCIAARCTPDCRLAGNCACANNDSCENGFVCSNGQCLPDGGEGSCVADDECPDGDACIDGVCRGPEECNVQHPDLEGTWDVRSELRLREALPGWLDGFLSATAEPFRFLAGQSDDLGIDVPIIGDLIEDEVRDWADDNLPPWSRDLMGAIADLNDILSTMQVRQRWDLDGTAIDEYAGEETWSSIAFTFRGEEVEGRPEDILGWDVSSSPFTAHANCGVLYIDRYDVDAAVGAIIAWLVDTLVYIVSDGQYDTLAEAMFDFERGNFCPNVADAADDLAQQLGAGNVYNLVLAACDTALGRLIDDALDAINEAMLEFTALRLQGRADISDANTLSNGHWAGTMAGRDFTGDFRASRRR